MFFRPRFGLNGELFCSGKNGFSIATPDDAKEVESESKFSGLSRYAGGFNVDIGCTMPDDDAAADEDDDDDALFALNGR